MGMSDFYGPRDDAQSMDTLERALELGVTFWDTSDAYGPWRNEELVGKAIRGRRAGYGFSMDVSDSLDPRLAPKLLSRLCSQKF